MKYIDAEKFNRVLQELEDEVAPEKPISPLTSVYWNGVSIALHIVRKAVELSSVEEDTKVP